MRSITVTPEILRMGIPIGRIAEENVTEIRFPLRILYGIFGNSGTFQLLHKRNGDNAAYPCITEIEGDTLVWIVGETDAAILGRGECELIYTNAETGQIGLDVIYETVTLRSLLEPSDPPDPYEQWLSVLLELAGETQENAAAAAQSATEAGGAADAAAGSASDAAASAGAADTSAINAGASERAAAGYADAADRSASGASGSANAASGYASAAQGSALAASGSASASAASASAASGSAGAAAGSATAAAGSATDAAASAAEAAADAQKIEDLTVTAHGLDEGEDPTVTKTGGEGAPYNLDFGIPAGATGATGPSGPTGETGNGIASITKTGTSGNVDTYTITYTDGATTTFTVTNGSVTSVNGRTGAVTGVANIDGYYGATGLGAYTAEQLIASTPVRDSVPYLFRVTAGGYDTGILQNGNIVGGTICWNQLWDGIVTDIQFSSERVVLLDGIYTETGDRSTSVNKTSWIFWSGMTDVQVYDLTLMFGSDIANYLYETDHAAAISWFRSLFPRTDYEFNTGELISVKTSAHILTGFNAFDPETGTAKLVGGARYQITGTYTGLTYSTGETITPDATGHFTPTLSGVLTVTGGNSTDTCVHLSHSGYRDGEFEQHNKHVYPLDSDLTLSGVYQLDSSNRLYCTGDTYHSDGTVERFAKCVTLNGDETWTSDGSGDSKFFMCRLGDYGDGYTDVGICDKYVTARIVSSNTNLGIYILNSSARQGFYIYVRPENTAQYTTKTWKEYLALNPFTVIWISKTATTETADPYQNPQIGDDFGTEEFADNRAVPVPVGHDTTYQANLRDKLQRLPNVPAQDGTYLVSISGGQANFMRYSAATELPTPPTDDGTYQLKTVIVDGVPTIQWVQEV